MAQEDMSAPEVQLLDREQWTRVATLCALVISIAFQAMTIARNNYTLWNPEFIAIETVVAIASSLLANLAMGGLEERGAAWARTYVHEGNGLLYRILAALPLSAVRAAIMTACLSAVNATLVPIVLFRETVEMPPVAIVIRFLADIPQAIFLCLVVYLLFTRPKKA